MRAATPLLVAAALVSSALIAGPAVALTPTSAPVSTSSTVTVKNSPKAKHSKPSKKSNKSQSKKTNRSKKSKRSNKPHKPQKSSKGQKQNKQNKRNKSHNSKKLHNPKKHNPSKPNNPKKSHKPNNPKKLHNPEKHNPKKSHKPKKHNPKKPQNPQKPNNSNKSLKRRTPAVGHLRVAITGTPRGSLYVRGKQVHVRITTSEVLRLHTGPYIVRAAKVTVDGDTYTPNFRVRRVRLHKGDSRAVTVDYAHTGSSAPGHSTPQNSPDTPPQGEIAAVFALVNEARSHPQTCGTTTMDPVDPLVYDGQLGLASQRHAQDMADNGYFEHVSLDGRSFIDRIGQTAYSGDAAGENIAMGFDTAKEVVDGWLASPGHCLNLMEPRFDEVGLGLASHTDPLYSTPMTYWVQDFGYALTSDWVD